MIPGSLSTIMLGSGESYDVDAQAFIDATGITDTTQKDATNTLVLSLKSNSLWTKMSALYPFVGGTATTHKFNLKNPLDTDAAFRLAFSGGLTHDASGILPNGSTGYADTFFNPITQSLAFDSAHLSFYQTQDSTFGTSRVMIGANASGTGAFIGVVNAGGTQAGGLAHANAPNWVAIGTTPSKGLFTICTDGTDRTQRMYVNGTSYGTPQISTGSYPNLPLFLFANNTGTAGLFCNKRCAFATIGSGLDATDSANLYTAIQAFQTTLGRQV